jgi:antitoxin ParD1/3/4
LTIFVIQVTIKQETPMNVSLTPELEKFVSDKVDSGRYTSASEVVREALRLLEQKDRDRDLQLAAFNRELENRIAALDRGEYLDPETVRAYFEDKAHAPNKKTA